MTDATFVASRALTLDDASYSISVYCSEDRYFAYWECNQCEVYDSATSLESDQDGVILECEQRIKDHHREFHAMAAHA